MYYNIFFVFHIWGDDSTGHPHLNIGGYIPHSPWSTPMYSILCIHINVRLCVCVCVCVCVCAWLELVVFNLSVRMCMFPISSWLRSLQTFRNSWHAISKCIYSSFFSSSPYLSWFAIIFNKYVFSTVHRNTLDKLKIFAFFTTDIQKVLFFNIFVYIYLYYFIYFWI